jgi:hypothetical protein
MPSEPVSTATGIDTDVLDLTDLCAAFAKLADEQDHVMIVLAVHQAAHAFARVIPTDWEGISPSPSMRGGNLSTVIRMYRLLRAWYKEQPRPSPAWITAESRKVLAELRPVPTNRLALADGGFTLWGTFQLLTGRPQQLLTVLLASRHNSATSGTLRSEMDVDDEGVSYPEQVVRDAAKDLRTALRKAAGKGADYNPVPSTGRGDDLTYHLDKHLLTESPNSPE